MKKAVIGLVGDAEDVERLVASAQFEADVDHVLADIGQLLKAKNRAYGNSALEPMRCFSQAGPHEQLLVRIDDKLSRIKSGSRGDAEDTVKDLIGYLVLLRITELRA